MEIGMSERGNSFFVAHKNNISNHIHQLNKDLESKSLEILAHFDSVSTQNCWNDFSRLTTLKALTKEPICFIKPHKQICFVYCKLFKMLPKHIYNRHTKF